MIFFNKNPKHDRNFIEIQTKLNFAYWIAHDIDHFYEVSKDSLNNFEYTKLKKQLQEAFDIFQDIDIRSSFMSESHKQCLYALRNFTESCLKDLDIVNNTKLQDSESEDIYLLNLINSEKDFHSIYLNYLHPKEIEAYVLKSFSLFSKGGESLLNWSSELEFENYEKMEKLAISSIESFRFARFEIENAIKDPNTIEYLLDELEIISNGVISEKDSREFLELNFDYLRLWKEYFLTFERYCIDIFDEENREEAFFEVFDFESKNCLSYLNILALKINMLYLKKMDVSMPNLEIFSQRIIKSPIDYIQNKRA
tara:strand:+ start:463 stop:1395 length:933 start_codon:yes stop_codon:yes gene_type:complete